MSIDRGVDQEVVHIQWNITQPGTKRKEIPAFLATWMDLEIIMLSEIGQIMPVSNAITDMWNLKKGHNERLCRTDTDSQTLKTYGFQMRQWGMH